MKLQQGLIYKVTDGSGLDSGRVGKLIPTKLTNKSYENYLLIQCKWVQLADTKTGERFSMAPGRLALVVFDLNREENIRKANLRRAHQT